MQMLRIHSADAVAEFSPHGGQLLRWRAGGRERLFLSPRAVLDGSTAIRGGVPVIFPQFNARGPFVRHGFARTQRWQPIEQAEDQLRLQLTDSDSTLALWPHRFDLQLLARITPEALSLELSVENRDDNAFEFSCALHSYFACAPAATRVLGLQGCAYEEKGALHAVRGQPALQPVPPLDRVYRGPAPQLTIESPNGTLALECEGFRDWVVWNPGPAGGEALADLGAEAAQQFLCVEPGCIFEPVRLAPGQRWRGQLRMRVLA